MSTVAIGCLVQWFEIQMISEYLNSLKESAKDYKQQVYIDLTLNIDQTLEKVDTSITIKQIQDTFIKLCREFEDQGYQIDYRVYDKLYTIADYRRDFNSKYCNYVETLVWGESDMLLPSQAVATLLTLQESVKEKTPKWIGFFATCKMWDDSWTTLEHPEVTNLPRDPYAWYGTRRYMSYEKMEEINSNTEELDVNITYNYKFNGCGLVLSSELVKSGLNIPQSVFFTHEDTALQNYLTLFSPAGQIPQYVVKNILLVHNREHPNKRMHVAGEVGKDLNEKRKSNTWYRVASEMSKHNAYNITKQQKAYTWKDVWKAL